MLLNLHLRNGDNWENTEVLVTIKMKIVKIILIAATCGLVVFLLCALLTSLVPSNSDAMGNALQAGYYFFAAMLAGLVFGIIALILQLKGVDIKIVILVSLIPVALTSAHVFSIRHQNYTSRKYFEKLRAMDNPLETTDREALLAKLSAEESINKTNENGQTLLHYAVYNRDTDLIKFCVENGADVNMQDNKGYAVAFYALWDGKRYRCEEDSTWSMLTYLADNGADLTNVRGDKSLLFYAVNYAGPDEVSMLIKQGLSVHALEWNHTPLFSVWGTYASEKMRILIDAGADVNFNSEDDYSPTPIFAYLHDHPNENDVLKLLIEEGADIEIRNSKGDTPLLTAINRHAPQAAMILVNSGANIHIKNNENDTPLLLEARRSRGTELLKILIERGADKNAIGSEGKIAHFIALSRYTNAHEIEFLRP